MSILSLLIGNRFRKGRQQGGMVSLVSIISTLTIAIGIAALIIGLSAMNGFERELKDRILSVIPHGEINARSGTLNNWRSVQEQLMLEKDIVASAPFVSFSALIEKGPLLSVVQVKGVDPKQEEQISTLPQYVANNQWQNFTANKQQIIIGEGLARELKVQEGDWVTLMIPVLSDTQQLKPSKRVRVQVAGILMMSGNLGHKFAMIPLADAQNYQQLGDNVTGVILKVEDVFAAAKTIYNAAYSVDEPITAKSWEAEYGYMYNDIQLVRAIMYLSMIVVIGVACFNIVSTLVIAVKDKQSDIAILKTLGANNRLIRRIFIWYGLLAGTIGAIIGTLIGSVLAWQLSNIMMLFEKITGRQLLDSKLYFIDFLPTELRFNDVAVIFIITIILSLVASYYPARRAYKIDPAKVLSGM